MMYGMFRLRSCSSRARDWAFVRYRILVHPLQDGGRDEGRLLLLRVGPHEADLLPFLAHRHALLRDASFVIGDQRVGRVHDVPRGPVVALQAEGFRLREILLEIQDVLDLGAAEGVDGLGVVSDHAQVPVHRSVLVLVHHDGVEALGDGRQRVGALLQQDVHVQEDVVEVHHPRLPAQLAVSLVHPVDLGFLVQAVVVAVAAGAVGVRRGRDQVVLRLGDAGKHLLGLVQLVVQAQPLEAVLDGAHGIGRIVDGESRGKADGVGELPQEADEDGMEGAHPDAAGLALPHHLADALLHLAGRFLGKGQGQDPGGIRPFLDHVGDSGSQYAGLPGACPRHDQHRSFHTLNRLPLLLVQILEYRTHICQNFLRK